MSDLRMRNCLARGMRWIRRRRRRSAEAHGLVLMYLRITNATVDGPTEQILRLFSLAERHALRRAGRTVQLFHSKLTDLQRQVLRLLGVPLRALRP